LQTLRIAIHRRKDATLKFLFIVVPFFRRLLHSVQRYGSDLACHRHCWGTRFTGFRYIRSC
jgi:hypothetical protein